MRAWQWVQCMEDKPCQPHNTTASFLSHACLQARSTMSARHSRQRHAATVQTHLGQGHEPGFTRCQQLAMFVVMITRCRSSAAILTGLSLSRHLCVTVWQHTHYMGYQHHPPAPPRCQSHCYRKGKRQRLVCTESAEGPNQKTSHSISVLLPIMKLYRHDLQRRY